MVESVVEVRRGKGGARLLPVRVVGAGEAPARLPVPTYRAEARRRRTRPPALQRGGGVVDLRSPLIRERRGITHAAHADRIARFLERLLLVAAVEAAPCPVVADLDLVDGAWRGDARSAVLPDAQAVDLDRLPEVADRRVRIEGGDGLAAGCVGLGDEDDVGPRLSHADVGRVGDAALLGQPPGEVLEPKPPASLLGREVDLAAARRGALERRLDHRDQPFAVLVGEHVRKDDEVRPVVEARARHFRAAGDYPRSAPWGHPPSARVTQTGDRGGA